MTPVIPYSASAVSVAVDRVAEKILADRPTLYAYLRSQAQAEEKSHKEWEAQAPGCAQSSYRAGSSNSYSDVARKLADNWFKPEPRPVTAQPTIAQEIAEYKSLEDTATGNLLRRVLNKLVDLRCPTCGSAVNVTIE